MNAPGTISIEQLNESQWHAVMPDGRATGVTNWVDTLSYALVCSFAYGHAVESTDLRGARLLLVREEARHG